MATAEAAASRLVDLIFGFTMARATERHEVVYRMRKRVPVRVDMMNHKRVSITTDSTLVLVSCERCSSVLLPFFGIGRRGASPPKMGTVPSLHFTPELFAAYLATGLFRVAAENCVCGIANRTSPRESTPYPSIRKIAAIGAKSMRAGFCWYTNKSLLAIFALESVAITTPFRLAIHGLEFIATLATRFRVIAHTDIIVALLVTSNIPEYAKMARRRIANPNPEPEVPDADDQLLMDYA